MQFLVTHWQQPLWLLLLPIVGWVWMRCFKQRIVNNTWHTVCDPHLLPHLLTATPHAKQQWPWWGLALAWCLSIIALAGPSWQQQTIPVYQHKPGYMIVLDNSDAMYSDDLKPSRLMRARYKVSDILEHLPHAQIGVIAFAGEAYAIAPMTEDRHTIQHLVNDLSPEIMPVPGYQLSDALTYAQQLLRQAHITDGHIILLTAGPVSQHAIDTARHIHQHHVTLSVLALGSDTGAPMKNENGDYAKDQHGNIVMNRRDSRGLQQLAHAGGGAYANFSTKDDDIQAVLSATSSSLTTSQPSVANTLIDWKTQGRYLLFPVLLLALLCFRRGWLTEVLP